MTFVRRAALCSLLLGITVLASSPTQAQSSINWDSLQKEAVELFVQYLKIDTTNPPGNETRAANFFAELCKREGIEHQVFEPFPGRGTLWARLKGNGSQRPIVLLNHTDVVPHSPEFWSVTAFSGQIKDGFIYGRGAQDMKSVGMAQFMVMVAMKRAKVPLKRDIIFLATADEEAGGLLGKIRKMVAINLSLGVVTIAVAFIGYAWN